MWCHQSGSVHNEEEPEWLDRTETDPALKPVDYLYSVFMSGVWPCGSSWLAVTWLSRSGGRNRTNLFAAPVTETSQGSEREQPDVRDMLTVRVGECSSFFFWMFFWTKCSVCCPWVFMLVCSEHSDPACFLPAQVFSAYANEILYRVQFGLFLFLIWTSASSSLT